jgi:hypothetical protein
MEGEGGSFAACQDPVSGLLTVDADPATAGCQSGGPTVVESCSVCHGDVQGSQNTATAHGLN